MSSTGRPTSSPSRAPGSARSSGRRSTPSSRIARSQDRWLSPTCSSSTRSGATPKWAAKRRWKPMATLHRPRARWPSSRSAWVTMPTGFVKSTSQAPGAPRRAASSAISRTTGTVRRAFRNPPGPVVSWPTQPKRGGIVSSRYRAAWPPTRSWRITKSAPSSATARRSVIVSRPVQPFRARIRPARPPTIASRSASGSRRTSSSTGRRSSLAANPSTSSGVYVLAPPTTAIFTPMGISSCATRWRTRRRQLAIGPDCL